MFNPQSDLWLFKSLQEHYAEESTEEAIIRRAAEARKVQTRLLEQFKAEFSAFGAKLRRGYQPGRRVSEPALECVSLCEGGTTR